MYRGSSTQRWNPIVTVKILKDHHSGIKVIGQTKRIA